ncbi:MAG TPA: hypothetical protein VGK29_10710, partial [Paludibaculum sp.]
APPQIVKCSRRSRPSHDCLAGTARSGQGREAAKRTLAGEHRSGIDVNFDGRRSGNTFLLVSLEHPWLGRHSR